MAATPVVKPEVKTEQWHEERQKYIGGSDAASLFDAESKYGCSTRLFFQKSGTPPDYSRPEREEEILRRGNIWESVVSFYFQEQTGFKVRKIGLRTSKEHPSLGVRMDRQIIGLTTAELKAMWPNSAEIQAMEGECGPGYLECKTTNEWMFKGMMKDGITVDYIFQVNHGLVVTGYKWGVFAVLEPTWGQFATFPVVFMPSLAEEQIKRSEAFWQALEANQMPAPKVNDSRCKSCLWRRSCPRSKELMAQADKEWSATGYEPDDSLSELVSDYREASAIADEKAETVEAIKLKIKEAMGERSKVEVPSCGVRISWTTGKPPMRWDSKALDGTVQVLAKYDIPKGAVCENASFDDFDLRHSTPECESEARMCIALGPAPHVSTYLVCEPHGFRALKLGKDNGYEVSLVAQQGSSELVANCKRPGEPSRPFKFMEV